MPEPTMPEPTMSDAPNMSEHGLLPAPSGPDTLVHVLDRLLDTGVVVDGQLVLTVAGVDLIYVGLRALLASMDTASRMMLAPASTPAAEAPR